MIPEQLKKVGNLSLPLGFDSMVRSSATWFLTGGTAAESSIHTERFGVFVGLSVPTFLILSNTLDRHAERFL